jgi:hypothetical protein
LTTKIYCTTTEATDVTGTPPDGGKFYETSDTQPSTVETHTNTVDGPVSWPSANTHCTVSAGGSAMTFVSPPVDAFTLDDDIYCSVSARESNSAANVARIVWRLGRLSAAGVLTWAADYAATNECNTSWTTYSNSGAAVTPDTTEFAQGDRIVFEFYMDDPSASTMATGYTYDIRTCSQWFAYLYNTVTWSDAVVQEEAGTASVSVSATGALRLSSVESATASAVVTATGAETLELPESGATDFALTGAASVVVIAEGELPEAGSAVAAVAATGSIALVAGPAGVAGFSLEGQATEQVTLSADAASDFSVAGTASLTMPVVWQLAGTDDCALDCEGDVGMVTVLTATASAAFRAYGDAFVPVVQLDAPGTLALSGDSWLAAVAHGADTFTAIGYIRTASIARLWLTGDPVLPATDDLGWTAPDAEASDLLGLTVTLADFTLDRAQIGSLTIELSNEGGPVSASMSIADPMTRMPTIGSTLLVTYKAQTLFRGRLEQIGSGVGDSTGYALTFAGPMVKLRDHKSFRTVYRDSDLSSWLTDQGPRTSPDTFEVMSGTSGNS